MLYVVCKLGASGGGLSMLNVVCKLGASGGGLSGISSPNGNTKTVVVLVSEMNETNCSHFIVLDLDGCSYLQACGIAD